MGEFISEGCGFRLTCGYENVALSGRACIQFILQKE
jgi:hypothetical protein